LFAQDKRKETDEQDKIYKALSAAAAAIATFRRAINRADRQTGQTL